MQQGKRPYKISGVYKGQGPKSFWHSQKIEAESPVFCEAKKAHGKNWCTPGIWGCEIRKEKERRFL
jgi:hypothetical protein